MLKLSPPFLPCNAQANGENSGFFPIFDKNGEKFDLDPKKCQKMVKFGLIFNLALYLQFLPKIHDSY